MRSGRILGHEAVGTVVEAGEEVRRVRPGDRVLVSCISACGTCRFCREGRYGQCTEGGGWVLGHRIDGTQAEYVRVPYADTSTYLIPGGVSDTDALMLADVLPTGYEVGVLAGKRTKKSRRRAMKTLVKDVMTTQVVWVEHDTPFAAIAAALRQFRVSAFPVLDDAGRVVGVVSESDLLAKMALEGGEGRMPGMITGLLRQHEMEKARAVTAQDLMTSPAETVAPDDTVEHAARLMYLRRVKRLPVVDEAGHLAGIVSRADVLAVYGRPGVEIGEEIRNDIAACESAADAERFDLSVTDGVVTLTGRPRTRTQGHDIVRRARYVQGVVAVRDRLDYPPAGPDTFDVLASFPAD